MSEGGERSVGDLNAVRFDDNGDGFVEECELFVGVLSRDSEVELGSEVGGGVSSSGEVELGKFESGKGEIRAVRVVKEVEGAGGNGEEEDKGEEENGGPDAAEAAAGTAATVVAAGLGSVDGAVGAVRL